MFLLLTAVLSQRIFAPCFSVNAHETMRNNPNQDLLCVICQSPFTKIYLVNRKCEEFDFPQVNGHWSKLQYLRNLVQHLHSIGVFVSHFDTIFDFSSDKENSFDEGDMEDGFLLYNSDEDSLYYI